MFSLLLDSVDSHTPLGLKNIGPDEHKALLDDALPSLSLDAEQLLGVSAALFGDGIFESSDTGFEYSHVRKDESGFMDLPIAFGGMYIRPKNSNREISLGLNILRSFTTPAKHHPSCVALDMEFRGLLAKQAFEGLYRNYRAQITRLLEYGGIGFETSYCSNIVGKTKSKKIAAKLDEYFSDPEVDNHFTLTRLCPRGTSRTAAMRSFISLSLIYSACRSSLSGKNAMNEFERNLRRLV